MEKQVYKTTIKNTKGKYVTDVFMEEKCEIIEISTGKEFEKFLKKELHLI